MPVIYWNDCFSVGIPQIDEHHRHLFFLVNKTYDEFISRDSAKNFAALFDELIDYATYHFSMEEHWMRESKYPDLAIHQKEHEIFSKRVVELQSCYHKGEIHLSLEVLTFLHT
jgi:hemerythrin